MSARDAQWVLCVAGTAGVRAPAAGSAAEGAHPRVLRREPPAVWESAHSPGSPRGARRTREPEARHPVDAGGGLESPHAKRFVCTTDSDHDWPVAANLLNRQFTAEAPNQRWVGDTTEFTIGESGKLYLAAILDLFSRFVVGWAISAVNDRHLALAALMMALNRRCPETGLLHHSDRGSTYASGDYQDRLATHGITCSMSRTGDCYDNAVMEAFFSTLKTEVADRIREPRPRQARAVRLHRGVLQHPTAAFDPRLRQSRRVRAPLPLGPRAGALCVIRSIAGMAESKNRLKMPQERFSRKGSHSGIPYSRHAHGHGGDHAIEHFREVEDDVDAATPVDAQNAPTGVWKSRKEREIPTASTSIICFSNEDEERRTQPLRSTVHRIGSPPGLPADTIWRAMRAG